MPCYGKLRIFRSCLYFPSWILDKETSVGICDVKLPREQDHERCCRTNKKGVHINGKPLHQSLLDRMAYRCCRCGMGRCSLSGLVAVNATLYAPRNSHTDNTAKC